MELIHVFILATMSLCNWLPADTTVMYVLPDSISNMSCPSQPCATFSHYLLDHGTLDVVSDVEYYLFPGEHHVQTDIILKNLCNFSLVGITGIIPPSLILVGNLQSSIRIEESYNVTIRTVVFTRDHTYYSFQEIIYNNATNLVLDTCNSCTLENITFFENGPSINNLLGISHFNDIMIIYSQENSNMCHKGILLKYWDEPQILNNSLVLMNKISMNGKKDINLCSSTDNDNDIPYSGKF